MSFEPVIAIQLVGHVLGFVRGVCACSRSIVPSLLVVVLSKICETLVFYRC